MKKRIVLGLLVIGVAMGAAGYWDRYEYFKIGRGEGIESEFRTNRYTNETDALGNHGWFVVQTSKEWSDLHWNRTHPTVPLPVPEELK